LAKPQLVCSGLRTESTYCPKEDSYKIWCSWLFAFLRNNGKKIAEKKNKERKKERKKEKRTSCKTELNTPQ